MSVEAMSWVLKHSPASGTDKVVLLGIANHADNSGGNAWPSIATLATYARVNHRGVQRAIRRLENSGALVVEFQAGGDERVPDGYRPNRYRIVMQRGGAEDTPTPETATGVAPKTPLNQNLGVALVTDRGGASATQTVLEPSLEVQDPKKDLVPRRDPIWDTLVHHLGEPTPPQRTSYGQLRKFIADLDYDDPVSEINRRCAHITDEWGKAKLTEHSLLKWWNRPDSTIGRLTDHDIEHHNQQQTLEAQRHRLTGGTP